MYYTLSTINFTKKLLSNIHGLKRDNVLYDLKIVCDNGEVWEHPSNSAIKLLGIGEPVYGPNATSFTWWVCYGHDLQQIFW